MTSGCKSRPIRSAFASLSSGLNFAQLGPSPSATRRCPLRRHAVTTSVSALLDGVVAGELWEVLDEDGQRWRVGREQPAR